MYVLADALKFCMRRRVCLPVRGKGHLHTCIAGMKDNLRRLILRKDNPKTKIKILVYQKISSNVTKLGKPVRKLGKSE